VQRLRGASRVPQRGWERGLQCSHGVGGPALQGPQVEPFHHSQDLARCLGDLVMTAGQVLGQPDVTGGRIKAQMGQGTGVVVHRTAFARA
jgi:hypothetical protein